MNPSNTAKPPSPQTHLPDDIASLNYERDLGDPGEFPYTRGIYPTMYQGRLWTMRQFSGHGTAEETNRRFRFLLDQGQTGLSVAFDLPTLMGLDSDNSLSTGEVGKCGVAIDSLHDMETLFQGIDLARVSTSMTINAPAAVLLAMYAVVAEKQGVPLDRIRGTLQNDILKEYIAQKEWIYPPEPSMRLIVDTIEFCSRHLPQYNSISISGYHIREAGSTAVQELAFTLRDGIEYVEACLHRGLSVDDFAPRLSFFFNSHNNFFEEIAKFRSARRLWARIMKDRFGAESERSWMCRFHTQTAGCSLTMQQPENNIVRTALQAVAAVIGGTNSLHTNALDEAWALPTENSATLALRTQQILALESGVTETADPIGGSYYVEALTDRVETAACDYINRIDAMGGMVAAIEQAYPQREIQEASYQQQRRFENREDIVVGVNQFTEESEVPIETLQIGLEVEDGQTRALARLKKKRNASQLQSVLSNLKRLASSEQNLMPTLIEAVRSEATVGEICDALKDVFGIYQEPLS